VDIEQEWDSFKQNITAISKKVLDVKKQTPCWTTDLKKAILEKNKGISQMAEVQNGMKRADYVEKRNAVNIKRRLAKQECWQNWAKIFCKMFNRIRNFCKL